MTPLLSLGLAIGRNALFRHSPGNRLPTSPDVFRVPVRDSHCRERITGILQGFFTGFEVGLRAPRRNLQALEATPELFHPFYHEGRAMGTAARFSFKLQGFDRFPHQAEAGETDPFLFLKYVGLGFWLGFRYPRRADRVEALARKIGKYGDLVLDGYGFKVGFFDVPRNPESAGKLLSGQTGLSRRGMPMAAAGLGRSRWFFFMDNPGAAFEEARGFQGSIPEILGGLGLASGFTFPDELTRAYAAADSLGEEERRYFVKGIRIALYVRDVDQSGLLENQIAGLPGPLSGRARSDLEIARRVGVETRQRADFISAFHGGCLEDG